MSTNTAQDAQTDLKQLLSRRKKTLRGSVTCISISWLKWVSAWQATTKLDGEYLYTPKVERKSGESEDATCLLVHVTGDIGLVNALKLPSEVLGVKVIVQLRLKPKM